MCDCSCRIVESVNSIISVTVSNDCTLCMCEMLITAFEKESVFISIKCSELDNDALEWQIVLPSVWRKGGGREYYVPLIGLYLVIMTLCFYSTVYV